MPIANLPNREPERPMLLNYTDDGPGPVVVLIHGFPLDHSIWDVQRGSIGSVYRVIAPDLRGFGKSAAPEGDYLMDTLADEVIELLDALGLRDPVVIGGHSMGGYVALSIAARYPERLRGLILVNSRAISDEPAAALAREEQARGIEESGSVADLAASMAAKLMAPTTPSTHPQVAEKLRKLLDAATPRAAAGALRGMALRPDRTPDLPNIQVPTLVVAGGQDQVVPIAESRGMADAIPNAQFVEIADAGHLVPMESPDAFDAALIDFLGNLDA